MFKDKQRDRKTTSSRLGKWAYKLDAARPVESVYEANRLLREHSISGDEALSVIISSLPSTGDYEFLMEGDNPPTTAAALLQAWQDNCLTDDLRLKYKDTAERPSWPVDEHGHGLPAKQALNRCALHLRNYISAEHVDRIPPALRDPQSPYYNLTLVRAVEHMIGPKNTWYLRTALKGQFPKGGYQFKVLYNYVEHMQPESDTPLAATQPTQSAQPATKHLNAMSSTSTDGDNSKKLPNFKKRPPSNDNTDRRDKKWSKSTGSDNPAKDRQRPPKAAWRKDTRPGNCWRCDEPHHITLCSLPASAAEREDTARYHAEKQAKRRK